MPHCFEVATANVHTIGEGKVEEDIVDEVIVDKEVGYEKTDFLGRNFSNQEIKEFDGLITMLRVSKSYYFA